MNLPSPRLASGSLLAGRYRLEEPLGSGATAAVWRSFDTTLQRPVAVKLLQRDIDAELQARFQREGRILAGLDHPNLVRVLDAGADGDTPYIVMELVDGRPLHDLLAGGPVGVDEALSLAAQIAAALAHAHDVGVVHRDVKPSNIIVTDRGVPKVVDFGIARSDSATTVTDGQGVLGTAKYLAPEQAQGLAVDARTDVYSLGCVLYEMLTGSPPFTGDSAVAVAYRQVHEEPARLRSHRADIPPGVEAVVLRALAKDPASRQANARELAEELRGKRDGAAAPGSTAVLPTVTSLPTPPRRRRAGWIVAAVALLGIVAALATVAAGGDGIDSIELLDVRGESFDDASDLLKSMGLEVSRVDALSEDAPAGEVIGQNPAPGTEVEEGSTVQLGVSAGPPPVEQLEEKDEDDEKDEEDADEDNRGPGNGNGNGKGKD